MFCCGWFQTTAEKICNKALKHRSVCRYLLCRRTSEFLLWLRKIGILDTLYVYDYVSKFIQPACSDDNVSLERVKREEGRRR